MDYLAAIHYNPTREVKISHVDSRFVLNLSCGMVYVIDTPNSFDLLSTKRKNEILEIFESYIKNAFKNSIVTLNLKI